MVFLSLKNHYFFSFLVSFTLFFFCASAGGTIVLRDADDFKKVLECSKKEPFDCDIELGGNINIGSLLSSPLGLNEKDECIPFSGVFDGKGFSIAGIQMDSRSGKSSNSAFFCGLNGATVKSLKIDKSCSFSGENASALCLDALGDVTIEDVVNEASVTGTVIGAGFIGRVGRIGNAKISIIQCENTGKISINNGNEAFLSGFVAWISNSYNINLEIKSSWNNGELQATTLSNQMTTGGFVGFVNNVSNSVIVMDDSMNFGKISVNSGSSGKVGGFIGILYRGNNYAVKMSNSANFGDIQTHYNDQDDAAYCAGIIGYVSKNTELVVDLNNCTNHGSIGSSNVKELGGSSGFIGKVFAFGTQKTNISFTNCVNYGKIETNSQQACGIFCVQPREDQHAGIKSIISNCLSKGNISGAEKAYGISNIINTANNVVSMGTVTGRTNSYLFWERSEDVSSVFGLYSVCVNCDDSIIRFQEYSNEYYINGSLDRVDNKLNDEVMHNDYKIGWDKQLQLILSAPSSPYVIKSVSDFKNIAVIASQGLLSHLSIDIILEDDLNFSSIDNYIAWGLNDNGTCFPYSGTFAGNGHSITDLKVEGDIASLFCGLKNAVVSDLVIDSSCSFIGGFSSALSFNATESVVINNVTTRAGVFAFGLAAGFLCTTASDTIAYFLNCDNEGVVTSKGHACGFTCIGDDARSIILNSINKANITADYLAFGFCPHVFLADNVVNIGFVDGITQDGSFWDWEPEYKSYVSSIYGLKENCRDCLSESVELFQEGKNGLYYIGEGKDRTALVNTLNNNSEVNEYGLFWTKELSFSEEYYFVSGASGKNIRQVIVISLMTIILCLCL